MTIKYKFNKSSEARDCVVNYLLLFIDAGNPVKTARKFETELELKDYINSIQEPIEFITESDIDQVLMKEWIGEWELSYNCNECNNRNLGYYDDCDYNLCGKKKVKTGSPKLNNNWTFKIE